MRGGGEGRLQRPPPRGIGGGVIHQIAAGRRFPGDGDMRRVEAAAVRGRVGAELRGSREEARMDRIDPREGRAHTGERRHGIGQIREVAKPAPLRRPQPVKRQRDAPGPGRHRQRRRRGKHHAEAPGRPQPMDAESQGRQPDRRAALPGDHLSRLGLDLPQIGVAPDFRGLARRDDGIGGQPPRRLGRLHRGKTVPRLGVGPRRMAHRGEDRAGRRRLDAPPLPELVAVLRPHAGARAELLKIGGHRGSLGTRTPPSLPPRRKSHNRPGQGIDLPVTGSPT